MLFIVFLSWHTGRGHGFDRQDRVELPFREQLPLEHEIAD